MHTPKKSTLVFLLFSLLLLSGCSMFDNPIVDSIAKILIFVGIAYAIMHGHAGRVIFFILGLQLSLYILPTNTGTFTALLIAAFYACLVQNFNYKKILPWIIFLGSYLGIYYLLYFVQDVKSTVTTTGITASIHFALAGALLLATLLGGSSEKGSFGSGFSEKWGENFAAWMQKPGFWIVLAIIILLIIGYVKYHDQLFGKEDPTGKPTTGFIHFMKQLFTEQTELAKESVGFGTPTTTEKEIKTGIIFDKLYSPYPFYHASPEGLPLEKIVVDAVNVIVDTFKTPTTVEFLCKYKKQTYPFLGIGLADYNSIPATILGKTNPLNIIPKPEDPTTKLSLNVRCNFDSTTPDFRVRFESELQKKADEQDLIKQRLVLTVKIADLQQELDTSIQTNVEISKERYDERTTQETTYQRTKLEAAELQEKINKETDTTIKATLQQELDKKNKFTSTYEQSLDGKTYTILATTYIEQTELKTKITRYVRERDSIGVTANNGEEAQQEITILGTYKDFTTLTCLNVYTVNEQLYDGVQPATAASCLNGCGLAVMNMETPQQPWILPSGIESKYTSVYPLIVNLHKYIGGGGSMTKLKNIDLLYDHTIFQLPQDTTFIKEDTITEANNPMIQNINNKFTARDHGEVVSINDRDKTFYYSFKLLKTSNTEGRLQAAKICVKAVYDYQFSTSQYLTYVKTTS